MASPALERLLVRLYPRSFRRRFGAEWLEVAAWHRRSFAGARFGSARLVLVLLRDALTTLPVAWASAIAGRGRGPGRWESWRRDLRHAARCLLRYRSFTAAAVLSIALGIGANTAAFSVVDAVLLRPLPYVEPDRLAVVWNAFPGSDMARLPLAGPEVQMLRDEPGLFESVAGIWATSGSVLDREGGVTQVALGVVTPDFFSVLGVGPALGRSFGEDRSGGAAPPGVVLGHELWRERFGSDPAVLGTSIELDGRPVPVLGVLPEDFTLFFAEDGAIPPTLDVYRALPWDLSTLPPDQHYLRVIGRLRPVVGPAQASAAVAEVAGRARRTYPEIQGTGDHFTVHPLQGDSVRAARPVLWAMLAAVGLFLLLACANVASLVLSRTLARGRELAIRLSLGASDMGLARLLVAESLLISGAGALLGIGCGRLAATRLWALRPGGLARADAVPLDLRVLAFVVAVSVLATLAFALMSLLVVRRVDPTLGVRGGGGFGGKMGRRARELLTAFEVAIGVVLVVGSTSMVRSLGSLGRESIGFDPGQALTFKLPLSLERFPADADRSRMVREIERRLSGLPGVTAVGATSHLPFADWANWAEAAPPEGAPEEERSAYFADLRAVTPSYLPAVGAELVSGRFFDEHDEDDDARPVVVIDRTMAERAFPGRDAVGRVLEPSRFSGGRFVVTPAIVVGVIRDIRDRSPAHPSRGQVFWPFAQSPRWELTWYLRTADDPAALAGAVRQQVRAVDPGLAAAGVTRMAEYVGSATALTRFLALVGSVFSALALGMAAIGLYGVVSSVAAQRTHELGMRVILGAAPPDLLRDVLGYGLRIGGIGVALGLLAALGMARFLGGLVYGVSPRDPTTLAGVAGTLLLAAMMASALPARRAARSDPLSALRDA